MRLERAIDKESVKPIVMANAKAKITLKELTKEQLLNLNVTFLDDCCPTTLYPVRYNDGVLEYFDGTDYIPIDLGSSPENPAIFDEIQANTISGVDFGNLKIVGPLAVNITSNPLAVDTTAVLTSAQFKVGYFTSTSAAPVTITLPDMQTFESEINIGQASYFDFFVDNTGGASVVTVAIGGHTGLVTPVITGGATLTIAAGQIGIFRLVWGVTFPVRLFRLG